MTHFVRTDSIMSWSQIVEKIMTDCKSNDSQFREWLKGKEYLKGYFFSSLTYLFMWEIYKKLHHRNEDHFIVVAGREGTGKSFFALQMAAIVDPDFNMSRVCYDMKDYIKAIKNAKKGQAFILDEGNMFLFGREALQKHNVDVVKLFALMRQKNLLTIICVPNFFTLDSYVRKHRTNTLMYIHSRGHYTAYRAPAPAIISDKGRYSNMVTGHKLPPGSYWVGFWNNRLPENVSWKDYTSKKSEKYRSFIKDLEAVYNKGMTHTKEVSEQSETSTIEDSSND